MVETAKHRLKNLTTLIQATEVVLQFKLLNAFVTFGMPITTISSST